MRLVFRLFGIVPVFSVDVLAFEYEEEEEGAGVEAGSSHNFERDFFPLSPTAHHEWEWDDKKRFGFG